ncbi:glycosyltransferase family 1 protein [Exiguobacterium sp. SL-10]|uniref:glycosyltransferase family 4 protein n=1 Tax=unclassified Exiguobacterium TaxID=2644629 RepID=UPI00103C5D09|nr:MULTISPECIES: glycosyltransferase family 4 protein [unclassified Exiguobacterium]TCI21402.1 glycosyltransferase family 1 protein [Exiguobacterium sp. SL-9]TCI30021.1 glycosyltransferase family 1 protein [Exiguobacterium sp. SL-10]
MKPTLLCLSWRDIHHPNAGGAEVFTHEMLKYVSSRFNIIHLSPQIEGREDEEWTDGVRYIRKGTNVTSIVEARRYYKSHEKQIDLVIDQMNTHHYFTPLYVPASKRVLFIHQLTREIWRINLSPPVSWLGALSETTRLRLYQHNDVLTVSQSTADDLIDVGIPAHRIEILPEGLNFTPWPETKWRSKELNPTFLYVGRMSAYKGIDDAFKAFLSIKRDFPTAQLWIIGKKNEAYVEQHLNPLIPSEVQRDIHYFGFVSEEEKLERMSRATALLFPSRREGWGLTVSEAAAVGTPTIVYDAPGLRDAVQYGKLGYMTMQNTPDALALEMRRCLNDSGHYERVRHDAHAFAKTLQWSRTGSCFEHWLTRKLNISTQEGRTS